jgi:hypothetical protein
MGTIISFPAERCRPTQEVAHGHNCLFIPFPKQNQEPAAPRKQAASRAKKAFVGGKSKTKRTSLIAKVKIAQKQLGLSDDVYREILRMNFGVDSCTKLEERELVRLVSYFRTKGWNERPARKTKEDKHGKPLTMKDQKHPARPTLERIEAILAELARQGDSTCRGAMRRRSWRNRPACRVWNRPQYANCRTSWSHWKIPWQ